MKKAEYVIINYDEEYFVEISKQNKIVFTKNINEATKLGYSDAEELIPLIEHYTGSVAIAEQV